MKPLSSLIFVLILLSWYTVNMQARSAAEKHKKAKTPADYVNPNIGTIGHLLKATSPLVQMPHGMVKLAPNTTPGITDRYLADDIYSFPVGASWIMASTGDMDFKPASMASEFDHDFETVSPYYGAVLLEDYDIQVEYTVTEHAAYYRFTFPETPDAHILMGSDARLQVVSDHIIEGEGFVDFNKSRVWPVHVDSKQNKNQEPGNVTAYFHAEFSQPFDSYGAWDGEEIYPESKTQSGSSIGVFTHYEAPGGEQVEVKIGISYIDIEQARQNLEKEIPDWDFEQVIKNAKNTWNRYLGRIQVEGGTEKQRTIFYTALYRAFGRMTNITEYGRYYSGYDHRVHAADGRDFYTEDSQWDTYRCMHPLQMIVEPERRIDIITSYVRMYEQSGWMPTFPKLWGNMKAMIGNHSTVMITDSYLKGFRDFDVEMAYEGMKKNAMKKCMLSHFTGDGSLTELDRVYLEKGFFPALAEGQQEWVTQVSDFYRRESVSITLEHCYDDWALAQMAKSLGKDEDYAYFMKRAHNYQNVFHPGTGFMRPKTADGKWIEPFDPIWSGGQGGRDYYAENNGWNYTWHVQHDVQGLINLMGGREKFISKLDDLFNTHVGAKFRFLNQFPDMTGLIGMYAQGNEPSFHIPYLYNYAGAPWKTQKRLRTIMDVWYGAGPLGICGDEDGGSMSSWYVFSAIGFYPVCPGRPVYDIGSPVFEKAEIDLGNGETFVVEAKNVSARNKYIQSAVLNGEPLDRPWFEHTDIMNGGRLVLNMGPRPNKQWGSAPEAAPPSMSR